MAKPLILGICGSLRKDSLNKKLLGLAGEEVKALGFNFEQIDLKALNLPIFDEDIEEANGMPAGGQKLVDAINGAQALLIASPEYNGSITGALKNSIDWASRADKNPFSGKIVALIGTSPGWWGASKSAIHARMIFSHLQALVIPTQLTLPQGAKALATGKLDEAQTKLLKLVCTDLTKTIEKMAP